MTADRAQTLHPRAAATRADNEGLISETSALLNHADSGLAQESSGPDGCIKGPDATTKSIGDLTETTWQHESKVLAGYSVPMVLTFLLQQSLTVSSVFAVGHIGTTELASVSLATMTANITGYSVFNGLATSLDTLCAQAFGSGRKELVGLYTQRMVYFLWLTTIPVGIIWFFLAEPILVRLVPDATVAHLAATYLRIVVFGAPGYAAFEAIKRFVQAQGLFSAPLYVLIICAPLNASLNYLMVWHLQWGFIGAPLAVAVTHSLLPIVLVLYIRVSKTNNAGGDAPSCWTGFTPKAFRNWGVMIRLAIPGLLMTEAEVLAFEILTFAASRLGTTVLATQSVLGTLVLLEFQVPFALSIAASTRIGTHIGAARLQAARMGLKVTLFAAILVGTVNMTLFVSLRGVIPSLFSSDPEVISNVASIIPLFAAFQMFDALATTCNGILRGMGRQEMGGYVQLFCYYVVALPVSFSLGFALDWQLWGLWTGVALGLALVSAIELAYIFHTDWERSIEEARLRNQESEI
ncbi:hypothetical protein PV08_05321 [Exophiala spinifera]|uniref:MATE efflux family protein n=1 Tax=Exophiala spinifera TaxID=91928 RepID=A0A0D1YJW6_9EURO|nr:uncharacterized protein PV08_05321 [Exophiala spinifera]KIW15276.1 hypothetical protein PV08_05321 [Exophiala spinifera]